MPLAPRWRSFPLSPLLGLLTVPAACSEPAGTRLRFDLEAHTRLDSVNFQYRCFFASASQGQRPVISAPATALDAPCP